MKKIDYPDYLNNLNIDVMRLGLEEIGELLMRLGNPQLVYKTILVAGTNGKGSTVAMIASILRNAGYCVGLYTSPHLIDVRERIVIDGKMISRRDMNNLVDYIRGKQKYSLTYFELLTAVAFVYFQLKKVDIAVLEVGLGGRLDATNICRPLVSVITNISFDHTEYLGRTLEAIAKEKGEIIKQNGICITAAKQKKVLEVLKRNCFERKAKLYQLGSDINILKRKNSIFDYKGLLRNIDELYVAPVGEHQLANAALAVAAVEIAGKKGLSISAQQIRDGLKNVKIAARMETLQKNPLFILDGAHNPGSIDALCRTLKNYYKYRRMILIFACLNDKNYFQMLKKIAPLAYKIIIPKMKTPRAQVPDNINKMVKIMGFDAQIVKNVCKAIKLARNSAAKNDLILATGSLYLAGEVKQKFHKTASCDKSH